LRTGRLEGCFISAGKHIIRWRGFADNGIAVGSGIYFYTFTVRYHQPGHKSSTASGKVMLLK